MSFIKDRSRANDEGVVKTSPRPSSVAHTFRFDEGIAIVKNEETGRISAMIPIRVAGGAEEGRGWNEFLGIELYSFW